MTMRMSKRMHRWSKKAMLVAAALPLMQTTTGCTDVINLFGAQIASSTFNIFVSSTRSVLLQNFPSADLIQILLGGNSQPFFQG